MFLIFYDQTQYINYQDYQDLFLFTRLCSVSLWKDQPCALTSKKKIRPLLLACF